MSELDPISDLQARLAQLETKLTYARTGKAPPTPVDLLHWQANRNSATGEHESGVSAVMRSLQEGWRSLFDAFRNWATGVEERFSR